MESQKKVQAWIEHALEFEKTKNAIFAEAVKKRKNISDMQAESAEYYDDFFEQTKIKQSYKTVLQYYNMLRFWHKNSTIDITDCTAGYSILIALKALYRLHRLFKNDNKTTAKYNEYFEQTFLKNESPTKFEIEGFLKKVKIKYAEAIEAAQEANQAFDRAYKTAMQAYEKALKSNPDTSYKMFETLFGNHIDTALKHGRNKHKAFTDQLNFMAEKRGYFAYQRRVMQSK